MIKNSVKNVTITAMGISLFVVLSMCLRVPVFENYYICLGYVAMTVYCYIVGITSGTIVGTIGVFLYCVLTNSLRGMPGWMAGNLVLGIIMGLCFKLTKKIKKPIVEFMISTIIITIGTAIAILLVKSGIESILYEPFIIRFGKNIYAFVADALTIIASIPICKILEAHFKKIVY